MPESGYCATEERTSDPLCCCEYVNIEGERSHILAVCCDCEAIDDTFDRWFKRAAIPESNYARIWSTVTDRARVPWVGGARRCQWEILVPATAVPLLMLVATFSKFTMLCSLSSLPVIMFMSRVILRHQTQSQFYYIWTCSSFLTLLYVFEMHVVPMLLISFYEHLVFAILLSMALLCWYRVRTRRGFCPAAGGQSGAATGGSGAATDTYCERCAAPRPARAFHCSACKRCVLLRDHHCVWLDCCVGGANQRAFMVGLASVSLSLLQAGRLTVACVCDGALTPLRLPLLAVTCRPDSAAGAAALFGALYALAAAGLCAALLVHQCLLVSCGQTGCERRRRLPPPGPPSNLLHNWSRFLAGRDEPDPVLETGQQQKFQRPAGLEESQLPTRPAGTE